MALENLDFAHILFIFVASDQYKLFEKLIIFGCLDQCLIIKINGKGEFFKN